MVAITLIVLLVMPLGINRHAVVVLLSITDPQSKILVEPEKIDVGAQRAGREMALGLRRRAREPGESFGCRPNRPQRSLQERLLGFRALSAGPAKQLLQCQSKNFFPKYALN